MLITVCYLNYSVTAQRSFTVVKQVLICAPVLKLTLILHNVYAGLTNQCHMLQQQSQSKHLGCVIKVRTVDKGVCERERVRAEKVYYSF